MAAPGPRSPGARGCATLVFLLPMLLVFGLFSWWPIVRSFVMSVQQTNLVTAPEFVGLDNFRAVFADPLLGTAVQNTLWFALLALVFGYPVPLVAAVLMSDVRRGRGVFALLAYLPVVIPPAVAVLLWKVFYDAEETGVFNTALGWVGLGPVPWLESASTAMPALVLEATWAAAGGTVIIYLAALTSVPAELYDAAEVDGAGVWRKVWHVTMPHLRGIMLITLILQIIGTVQVFLEPYLFTDGGPDNATLTVLLLVYKYAFQNTTGGDYGKATALSLMLAFTLAVLSLIYFRATRRWAGVTDATVEPTQAAATDVAPPALPPTASGRRTPRSAGVTTSRAASPRRTSVANRCSARPAGAALRRCWCSCSSWRSGRCCGWPSPRSRRPRTRCARRWRCSRTAPTGRTCAPHGSTSTSSCTSGTPSSSRPARGRRRWSSP